MLPAISRESEKLVLEYLDVLSLTSLSEVSKETNVLVQQQVKREMVGRHEPRNTLLQRAFFNSKYFPNGSFTRGIQGIKLQRFMRDPTFWPDAENESLPEDVQIQDSSERVIKVFGMNSTVLTDLGNVYAFAKESNDRFPQQVALVIRNVVSVSVHETEYDHRAFAILATGQVVRCPICFRFPTKIRDFIPFEVNTDRIQEFGPSTHLKLYAEMYIVQAFVTEDNNIYYNREGFMPTYRKCSYFSDRGMCIVKVLLCGESNLVALTESGKVFICSRHFSNKDVHPKYGVFQSIEEVQFLGEAIDIFNKYDPVTYFTTFYITVSYKGNEPDTILPASVTKVEAGARYDI